MRSLRCLLLRHLVVKRLVRPLFDFKLHSLAEMRKGCDDLARRVRLPKGTTVRRETLAGREAEWITAAGVSLDTPAVVLYLHSGGFCLGYTPAHREFAARLSAASEARVLALDYRLAPEHPYPAANEDALAAYRALLERGIAPQHIIIGGESSGAGLALMTLLALREAGEALPAGAFLLSPYGLDLLRFDGESYRSRLAQDPMTTPEGNREFARLYLGGATPPPLFEENLAGLPPLFVQLGGDDIVLSDSLRLVERAHQDGVEATLDVWEGLWHVFQSFAAIMPEAKTALRRVGDFNKRRLAH